MGTVVTVIQDNTPRTDGPSPHRWSQYSYTTSSGGANGAPHTAVGGSVLGGQTDAEYYAPELGDYYLTNVYSGITEVLEPDTNTSPIYETQYLASTSFDESFSHSSTTNANLTYTYTLPSISSGTCTSVTQSSVAAGVTQTTVSAANRRIGTSLTFSFNVGNSGPMPRTGYFLPEGAWALTLKNLVTGNLIAPKNSDVYDVKTTDFTRGFEYSNGKTIVQDFNKTGATSAGNSTAGTFTNLSNLYSVDPILYAPELTSRTTNTGGGVYVRWLTGITYLTYDDSCNVVSSTTSSQVPNITNSTFYYGVGNTQKVTLVSNISTFLTQTVPFVSYSSSTTSSQTGATTSDSVAVSTCVPLGRFSTTQEALITDATTTVTFPDSVGGLGGSDPRIGTTNGYYRVYSVINSQFGNYSIHTPQDFDSRITVFTPALPIGWMGFGNNFSTSNTVYVGVSTSLLGGDTFATDNFIFDSRYDGTEGAIIYNESVKILPTKCYDLNVKSAATSLALTDSTTTTDSATRATLYATFTSSTTTNRPAPQTGTTSTITSKTAEHLLECFGPITGSFYAMDTQLFNTGYREYIAPLSTFYGMVGRDDNIDDGRNQVIVLPRGDYAVTTVDSTGQSSEVTYTLTDYENYFSVADKGFAFIEPIVTYYVSGTTGVSPVFFIDASDRDVYGTF